jgi:hypothetical protein
MSAERFKPYPAYKGSGVEWLGDRLHLTGEGQVRLQLRHRWSGGTTHLLFDPLELLERTQGR